MTTFGQDERGRGMTYARALMVLGSRIEGVTATQRDNRLVALAVYATGDLKAAAQVILRREGAGSMSGGQMYGSCGVSTKGHACGDEPCDGSEYGRYGEPEGKVQ